MYMSISITRRSQGNLKERKKRSGPYLEFIQMVVGIGPSGLYAV